MGKNEAQTLASGFIKTGPAKAPLSSEQKVALNRKGNLLFNQGDIEAAKRIFLTTRYSDGLIRVGDSYLKRQRPVEALQMYWAGNEKRKAEALIEKLAIIISAVLKEEETEND